MSLRINTNLASLSAQRNLSISQRELETTMKQLSTGNRFADPAEGPADYAIAESLKAQVAGQRAARNNADNAESFVSVAEGGLNEQNNLLIRMREIAIQSASDTYSDTERELMDKEYKQLSSEVDRVAKTTEYGDTKLLAGSSRDMEFQVGPNSTKDDVIKFSSNSDTTASALDIDSSDVADKYDARDSISSIDSALKAIAGQRAKFGAIQSRLQNVSANADVQAENLEAARSRIGDTDVAQASANLFKQQALSQYQISILAQANQFPMSALRLLA